MAGITAAIAAAATVIGTGVSAFGQIQASQASEKAERLRKRQLNLTSARRRREAVREALVARSTATANATNQGAQFGSGLAGGQSQIQGAAGRSIQDTNQAQDIGVGIFSANAAIARGRGLESIGGGISSLGGAIGQNQGGFDRLGTYFGFNGAT